MLKFAWWLFSLLLRQALLASSEGVDGILQPLRKQSFEQVEFPAINWSSWSQEEEREYKKVYDNVVLEKPEEYDLVIRGFEEVLANYRSEESDLEAKFKNLVNSMDQLQVLSKEDQIQQVLGGKGIVELSKLSRNLEFGRELLGKELSVSRGIAENVPQEIVRHFRQPIERLAQSIVDLSSDTEKYLKACQLLNVYRERSHQIYNLEQVISKNQVAVDILLNGWTYVLSELQVLIKDQFKPLADGSKSQVTSGNDILSRLELINSILTNTILLEYGKLGNGSAPADGENKTLIKEVRIKALNMEEIEISDSLISWRLEFIPSILNILRGPISKLLRRVNKDLENATLVDIAEKVHERIEETNGVFSELNQIRSKMDSLWMSLKYLSRDDLLVKNNEKIKDITDYEDVYNENQQKIQSLYEHANTESSEIDLIARNLTFGENHRIFLGLNTLKCLTEYYQVYNEGDESALFVYSRINQRCLGFFLGQAQSLQPKENKDLIQSGQVRSPVARSESIISHLIALIFPNSEESSREPGSHSPISELIQQLELSSDSAESNETDSDQSKTIADNVARYNEFSAEVLQSLDKIERTSSSKSFEVLRHYLEDLTNTLEGHIRESIMSKDDAASLFDQILKELLIMFEEFSEKELNNDYLRVSVSRKFEDVKFLFNDFIAKVNLEYQRSDRIASSEFIEQTRTKLEETDVEIRMLSEELSQVNEFIYQQHSTNILSLSSFVYTSKLILSHGSGLKEERPLAGEDSADQFAPLFREKYRYVLQQLGHYYKSYREFKEKKRLILDRENHISSQLTSIEAELNKRTKVDSIDPSTMHKIQKQEKIAKRILSGYLLLTITLYHSRSGEVKKVVTALDDSISNYTHHISVFKRQNKIGGEFKLKSLIKNIIRTRKFIKLRRYYRRMKKFQEYLILKREQAVEFLKFSEDALDSLNHELIKIVDQYLCKDPEKRDLEYTEHEGSAPNENMQAIQVLMGDLYNIFSRIGRLEHYHSPRYIMSNSKLLGQILTQYRNITQEINRYQKKAQRIFIAQQKTLDDAHKLVRIAIPASYMIRKYNKFPKEFQRYVFKAGKLDIIGDEPKHINIKGWNLKKGKKSLSLENELIIERKYVKNQQEFYEIKKEVQDRLREYSLLPPEKTLDTSETKTLFFLIPDDLVGQMAFETERNHIALRNGDKDEGAIMKSPLNDYMKKLLEKRKSMYTQLSSKPLTIKQAQCSTNNLNHDPESPHPV
ncbi:signal peptide-containing protein [Cryptosporidium canis]|uniref:Signal peptide-containing protein n=1 Tax=Cryptosporidium canis TaxID=195482 RepID=A0A9D5HX11_9CRYT|nr:signal peptide-containing protein [Cryptosporidium canis]